ncbi:MAG: class I SAM-dependent methyltransferase [Pirellulales bacterium]
MAYFERPARGKVSVVPHRAALDDPATTAEHARLIGAKPLLRRFYQESYDFFMEAAHAAPAGPRLEIGAGGGFFKELMPSLITSDMVWLPRIDVVTAGERLCFRDESLAAIFLLNVLHHIPDAASFFSEARRCLAPGGILALVEPANTLVSRFIYKRFHHEPFLPDAPQWQFRAAGRLSAANGALPWIVFCRDREEFGRRFPEFEVRQVNCCSPLLYLLSGGLSLPSLLPGFTAPVIHLAEKLLSPANDLLGLFMCVVLVRR